MFLTGEGSAGFVLLTPSGTAARSGLPELLDRVSGLDAAGAGAGAVPTALPSGCRGGESASPALLELLSCSHAAASAPLQFRPSAELLLAAPRLSRVLSGVLRVSSSSLPRAGAFLPAGVWAAARRRSQPLVAFEKSGMARRGGEPSAG